jgi:hypothetical protein
MRRTRKEIELNAEPEPQPSGDFIPEGVAGPLTTWVATQVTPLKVSRAEANIRIWQSYLPADCIETMMAMGWDEST